MNERKKGISIQKKLLISFFTIVVLILIVGVIGIANIQRVYQNGNEIYVNSLSSVEYLKSIHQNVKEIDQCTASMMSQLDEEYHSTYEKRIQKLQEENQELMDLYAEIQVSALEKRRYNQCRLSILTFNKQIASIVEQLNEGSDQDALQQYKQELMPAKACTYELIEAIVELTTKSAREKNEENYQAYQNMVFTSGIVMALSVMIAVIITLYMSKNFTSKLQQIKEFAQRISEYNISDDIDSNEMGTDEFGETMAALNESQFMIRDLVEKIMEESVVIGDVGNEVSQAMRKSGSRIEAVNVDVYKVEDKTADLEQTMKKALENRSLDSEIVELLQEIIRHCSERESDLKEVQSELTGIATYLEQIGITADYQNQIANSHREQVKRFKV